MGTQAVACMLAKDGRCNCEHAAAQLVIGNSLLLEACQTLSSELLEAFRSLSMQVGAGGRAWW